ncbi:MAG: hypothetical protein A2583_07300 [Bdellovibrionales bacterium RIFOXYD1_FULL_53_11]|nr:MAG: hypothetical protein A2583_07300 [Bdellovibrionales bacterium RIFOXYD1_FULL_53_11]
MERLALIESPGPGGVPGPDDTPGWLCALLENTRVTDICINGTSAIFADSGDGMRKIPTGAVWDNDAMMRWTLARLSLAGKTWDARHPFADACIPPCHRLHAAFPPVSGPGMLLSLRRLPGLARNNSIVQNTSAERIARWGAGNGHYQALVEATIRGDSIIIAGSTGSGKTTLACDLLSEVPPEERIIALEDTQELSPVHPHFLSLASRPPNADGCGEITLRTLLRQTLRMRPDRIVLGECRGAEVLDLLQAINTGHRGAMATLHASSPRDALRRIELLCLIASGGSIPSALARELIASGIQWVAHIGRHGPARIIKELWQIAGREGDTILMRKV